MTIGTRFDDFLKDENIEIDEEKIKENIEQMTDKEIIIDGVDVAGCKYLNKVVNEEPYCNIDEEHLYTCSSDENCYYKQLKRLEFENAELKAENERLKALCDTYKTCYQAKHNDIDSKLFKYRQTLQEIKAIAENAYCLTNYTNKDMANFAKQILCLITKAEEE